MSSFIDPITGVPYDALSNTLYSIPLNSQPALAPEWNPQGRITSTVYPDNLPAVLATLQAQNDLNPSTVQAATTDGAGNLNVNVKAGGGGGGGASFPFTSSSSGDAPIGASLTQWDTISPPPNRIYRIQLSVYNSDVAAFSDIVCGVVVSIGDYNGTLLTPIWNVVLFSDPNTGGGFQRSYQIDMQWPGGIVFPGTFDSGNPFTIWAKSELTNTRLTSLYWWD